MLSDRQTGVLACLGGTGGAPIHGDSSRVGGGGKHGVYLTSVYADSPIASRPCSVLSCSLPVLLVNNGSLLGRGGEVEHMFVGVNAMLKFLRDELIPCVFIHSDETRVWFCICEPSAMTKITTESCERWF